MLFYKPPSKDVRAILKMLTPPCKFTMDIVMYKNGMALRVYQDDFLKLDDAGRYALADYLVRAKQLIENEYASEGETVQVAIEKRAGGPNG